MQNPNEKLAKALSMFTNDPLGFVGFAFQWGTGELEGKAPEEWQVKVLKEIRDGLKTVDEVIQEAVASGHGVGKSALVSWLILWGISTFPDTRGIVTANTDTQLKTKTWPELEKWYRLFIAKSLFRFTATSIYSVIPSHEKSWRIDAIPWSENNTEAFAGLHNKNRRILLIFDEASGIADKIWEVSEGALTDGETQIIWAVFGNRTRNSGRFRDCFKNGVRRWKTHCVDSRTVSFTNKKQIQKWIDDLGEDSDFVRVRVRGLEPNASTLQFIPNDYVEAARGKKLGEHQYIFAPVILTVDAAWDGGDETVISKRQGNVFQILKTFPKNNDDLKIAGILAQLEDEHKADAVFIDFGYGTGIKSAGLHIGRQNWILVQFGGASGDAGFLNKRAEMWNLAKQWLKDGGCIPDDPILCADLTGPEAYVAMTGEKAGKVYLESKEDMKVRGLLSPNRGDSLALSFAFPVQKKPAWERPNTVPTRTRDYDPLQEFNEPSRVKKEYDPVSL